MMAVLILGGCSSDNNDVMAQTMTQKMNITIDGVTKSVTLVDNAAARALVTRLQESPVTVTLNSSGGFEIWGALGFQLPTSNEQVTAQPGDVILYNANCARSSMLARAISRSCCGSLQEQRLVLAM